MAADGEGQRVSMEALSLEPAQAALFRSIFDGHASYVAASLSRLGVPSQDRDDLTAEVFVRVCRALASYDPARSPKPWLFAFAMRVASEHRRRPRHRHEVAAMDREPADPGALADVLIERREAVALVEQALAEMDLDKRAVFVLHQLDETPIPEVALALGIAEGTAYSRLRAARAEFTAFVRRVQATAERRER